MPRRFRPEKRAVEPDLKYDNVRVSMFINRLMKSGKKSTARRILYDSFDLIEGRANKPPLDIFEQALQNVTPQVEVKPRRVGGATYQVPVPVDGHRQISLAMRWLLAAAPRANAHLTPKNLPADFRDEANNQGNSTRNPWENPATAAATRELTHQRG